MDLSEFDQYDAESDQQYRRVHRAGFQAGSLPCGAAKKKVKRHVRYRVEKFIFFLCRRYEVTINKRGLVFQKGGFKSLESARECRDEKLAGFVRPTVTQPSCRKHIPAIFRR